MPTMVLALLDREWQIKDQSDSLPLMNTLESQRKSGEFLGPRVLFAAGMAPPNQGPNDQFSYSCIVSRIKISGGITESRKGKQNSLIRLGAPTQAREQVKLVFEKGFKFIKIWVDDDSTGGSQSMINALSPELYTAVIDEARKSLMRR